MKNNFHILLSYFPDLSGEQVRLFEKFGEIFKAWNEKINLVSRKDIDALYERHILYSLAIAKFVNFLPATSVLDAGTGGGFPGLPLAIYFPDTIFHLVDSTGKKIRVVQEIADALGLINVIAEQKRVEDLPYTYDFITGRAMTNLPDFVRLTGHLLSKDNVSAIDNGILYLKGGEFDKELAALDKKWNYRVVPVSQYFKEDYFKTKKLVYLYR